MGGPIGANVTWEELLKVAQSANISLQSQSPTEPVPSSASASDAVSSGEPPRGRESGGGMPRPAAAPTGKEAAAVSGRPAAEEEYTQRV